MARAWRSALVERGPLCIDTVSVASSPPILSLFLILIRSSAGSRPVLSPLCLSGDHRDGEGPLRAGRKLYCKGWLEEEANLTAEKRDIA